MNYIEKDVLSGDLIPVLLGASAEAMQTARRFFRQYGRISRLFCSKPPISSVFSPFVKIHIVRHGSSGDRLMLTALKDYAKQFRHVDAILYLVPCTEEYANFVWRNRGILEVDYVIAGQSEMEQVWFGNTTEEVK